MEDKLDSDLEELINYTQQDQENRSPHLTGFYKLGFEIVPREESEPISFDLKTNYIMEYDNGKIEIEEIQKDRDKTFMPRPEGIRVHIKVTKNGEIIYNERFAWRREAHYTEYDE